MNRIKLWFCLSVRRRSWRRVLLAAALVALLAAMTMVPAFGYANVLQAVAYWTAEQFSFQPASLAAGQAEQGRTGDLPEEYAEVRTALEERGITSFTVPGYIPEGFQVTETDLFIWPTDCVDFYIAYADEENYFDFEILQYSPGLQTTYEKTDDPVEIYERGGVEHYIFSNNKNITAAWRAGELEYSIGTSLPVSELKKIIDSMYEE